MKTLFDQITHWKNIGEWESIMDTFPPAHSMERYYNIVQFIRDHRDKYGYRYRDKITCDDEFQKLFGKKLDQEYIKYAEKIMRQKVPIFALTSRD